jgi:hypothetical protein
MTDGILCAREADQLKLGKNLDELAILICDKNIHNVTGVSIDVFGMNYFLN